MIPNVKFKKWHPMMYNLQMKISFKLQLLKNVKILASQSQKNRESCMSKANPKQFKMCCCTIQEHMRVSKLDTMLINASLRPFLSISVQSNNKPFVSECHVDTSYDHILLVKATLPLCAHMPVRLVHRERQQSPC